MRTGQTSFTKAQTGTSRNYHYPGYESLDDIQDCLFIRNYYDSKQVDIIVVDNASAETVRTYLRELAVKFDITYIENDFNTGFTYAVNQGIKAAELAVIWYCLTTMLC